MIGFPHENLDCYRLAVGVASWVAVQKFPPRRGDLADQAIRAAQSVVQNIAEGSSRSGPAAELRRIGAMLRRLAG